MITPAQLRPFAAFRDTPDAELEILIAVASARRAPAGTLLCAEGKPGASCFLIVAGEVDVFKTTAAGEQALASLGAGAIVGQMALVDRGARSASVRVKSEAVFLELSRDAFERLLGAKSALALRFQEHTALAGIRQLRSAIARLQKITSSKAAQAARRRELALVQGAVNEWGIPLAELDAVEVVVPDGIASSAETRSRGAKR